MKKDTTATVATAEKKKVRRVVKPKDENEHIETEAKSLKRNRTARSAGTPKTKRKTSDKKDCAKETDVAASETSAAASVSNKQRPGVANTCCVNVEVKDVADVGQCDFCDTYNTHAYKDGNRTARPYTRVLVLHRAKESPDSKGGSSSIVRMCKLCQWASGSLEILSQI